MQRFMSAGVTIQKLSVFYYRIEVLQTAAFSLQRPEIHYYYSLYFSLSLFVFHIILLIISDQRCNASSLSRKDKKKKLVTKVIT